MKKIKWGRYILIGVIALFLHYVDFTLGTKTAIIVGLFLYLQISEQTNRIRLVKERVGFLQKQDTESEGHKESSYRLDIYIQPAWFKLYEKALGKTLNKKDIEKLEKKLEKSKDRDSVLW